MCTPFSAKVPDALQHTVPISPVTSAVGKAMIEYAEQERQERASFSLTIPYKTDEDQESQQVGLHRPPPVLLSACLVVMLSSIVLSTLTCCRVALTS